MYGPKLTAEVKMFLMYPNSRPDKQKHEEFQKQVADQEVTTGLNEKQLQLHM